MQPVKLLTNKSGVRSNRCSIAAGHALLLFHVPQSTDGRAHNRPRSSTIRQSILRRFEFLPFTFHEELLFNRGRAHRDRQSQPEVYARKFRSSSGIRHSTICTFGPTVSTTLGLPTAAYIPCSA